MEHSILIRALARAFLAGESRAEEIVARASLALGRPWRWLRPAAQRYLNSLRGTTRLRHRDVVQFLRRDRGVKWALRKYRRNLTVDQWLFEPQQMQPVAAAETWTVPAIESVGALADWLGLGPNELDWFADLKGLVAHKNTPTPLRHYRYRALSRRSGGLRLIEAPKPRLKELQRHVLDRILNGVPAHPAVHGFVKGRSIKTFTAPHVGQRVVLRMDLRDFFPSFSGARVQSFFRTVGYPESVADLLGGICTNSVPVDACGQLGDARTLYSRPHLPQGAPTSPALANACFYRADRRLAGLAKSAGAEYTRYADDLAFSGGEKFDRCVTRFSTHVAAILHEEGFAVNHRKTRITRQGVRQHLAGLVTNRRVNIARADFDRLKAVLTNCIRLGPESQNRESHPRFRLHLEGRVGFVESINPARGQHLRALFDQITWQ